MEGSCLDDWLSFYDTFVPILDRRHVPSSYHVNNTKIQDKREDLSSGRGLSSGRHFAQMPVQPEKERERERERDR